MLPPSGDDRPSRRSISENSRSQKTRKIRPSHRLATSGDEILGRNVESPVRESAISEELGNTELRRWELGHPYYRNDAPTRTPTSKGRVGVHGQTQNWVTANQSMYPDIRNQGENNYHARRQNVSYLAQYREAIGTGSGETLLLQVTNLGKSALQLLL